MIPGAFTYHRPKSIDEAAALLTSLGEEARPLAGGHSLIPMMKLRMATPEHLVDLAGIPELKGVCQNGGDIIIGAMTTQAELIASELLAAQVPILRETSLVIADPQIRYCGTLGGNVANGDPGNDMPAVMMTLDARYTIVGEKGRRVIPSREFYQGAYYTALEPGEFLVSVTIPALPDGHGFAYEKMKRKVGDYATAAAAVVLTKKDGVIATCALALTNVGDTALFAEEAAQILIGSRLDAASLARAAAAAEAIAAPATDGRGTAAYRTSIAGVMVARAVRRAFERA
ncbi:xanthine dehydrogenase family protein subunit M [uncultured Rhodoblastus sp.]|uniref:FAD binding domain-containing protein n=1 Tax=uncultured Rhodoblastus sp. TaxID=543037 RepID=UPI0025E41986|nr:xanthine dehydrogenase family protein subunit M [uncultured Rhodoblastus sp.]